VVAVTATIPANRRRLLRVCMFFSSLRLGAGYYASSRAAVHASRGFAVRR
jgi:hypothetical protein